MSVFVAVAAQTLLHLPLGKIPSLKNYLTELPVGMRLWGCYVLAHESYLKQEYEKSLGIIETCLTLTTKTYPIAMIYLNLMGAMDAMNLRKEDIAKKYLSYVYIGNVAGVDNNTYCPDCNEKLLTRGIYTTTVHIDDNKCDNCGKDINIVL